MVAYCNDCKRFVNQFCNKCGEGFGFDVCQKYACGGHMICPLCAGYNLSIKKQMGPDPYDYRRRMSEAKRILKCVKCGYGLSPDWKYCPMCGVSITV